MRNGKDLQGLRIQASDRLPQGAVFCRIEGVLVSPAPLLAAAWCAANSQRIRHRVTRLARLAASVSLGRMSLRSSAGFPPHAVWHALRGMSEDRMVVLGAEYCQRFIMPRVDDVQKERVQKAWHQKPRLVLISDSVSHMVQPLADAMGAELLWSNCLEFRDGFATGHLKGPVLYNGIDAPTLHDFAKQHHIDLKASIGYGLELR